MEHRWNERKTTRLDAMLDYPPLSCVPASVRDVCVGGALIETNAVTLRTNTPVHLMLRLPRRSASAFCRVPALVVWVGPGRAGLMFRSFDQEAYHALRALLYEEMFYDWVRRVLRGHSDGASTVCGPA